MALNFIFFISVTTGLIRLYLPDPSTLYASWRSEKLELINRLAESSNVATFGSSHIEGSFDPRVFDSEARQEGIPLKSVNLAIGGGNQIEQILIAKKYIEKKSITPSKKSSQLIFLEITDGTIFSPWNRYTSRAINLYDLEKTKLSLNLNHIDDVDLKKSIIKTIVILNSFILNSLNIGMLSSYIFINKKFDPELVYKNLEEDKRGYHVFNNKIDPNSLKKMVRIGTEKFASLNVENIIEFLLKEKNSSEFNFGFIAAPFLENKNDTECIKYPKKITVQNREIPIFNFTCFKKNPDLFSLENWSDTSHLNHLGAKKLSSLLAKEVTKWLKEKDMANAFH